MEDVVQRRGWCAMRAEHTHFVQHAAARRQQRGNMVSGCQLVIHNNTENPQTSLSLDVRARWRRRRTVATRRKDNFLRLGVVELEVICRRPCVQVLDLSLARVCANARYHQMCVVGKFEDSITRVYRMQVGRGNNVRGWS